MWLPRARHLGRWAHLRFKGSRTFGDISKPQKMSPEFGGHFLGRGKCPQDLGDIFWAVEDVPKIRGTFSGPQKMFVGHLKCQKMCCGTFKTLKMSLRFQRFWKMSTTHLGVGPGPRKMFAGFRGQFLGHRKCPQDVRDIFWASENVFGKFKMSKNVLWDT